MTEQTPSMQRPDPAPQPASMFPHADGEPVLRLDDEQAWRLLDRVRHARLGTQAAGRMDVVPVNVATKDRVLYFRTAPGTKLAELTANPNVVVQADGVLSDQAWSVQVHGTARELTTEAEIAVAEGLRFESWVPTHKHHYVAVTPVEVTGFHFLFGELPDDGVHLTD